MYFEYNLRSTGIITNITLNNNRQNHHRACQSGSSPIISNQELTGMSMPKTCGGVYNCVPSEHAQTVQIIIIVTVVDM